MRYFSFASRCRIFNQLNSGKRFVSYRTRKNLVSTLTDIMENFEVSDGVGLRSAAQKGSVNCSQFAVNVVSNGASGSNSIAVVSDVHSYLFNCGEGVQRLSIEHGQKLIKTKCVFITYHSWTSIGGIMGLCLTLQTQGAKQIVIYGPPSIKEMVLALRLFVSLKNISVVTITDKPKLNYNDSLFKVQFVPIYPDLSKQMHKTSSVGNVVQEIFEDDESELASPAAKRRCCSEVRKTTNAKELYSLCYICQSPEFDLHLNAEKCIALGVPCGPLMGVLKGRADVKLANGDIVHWQDVFSGKGKSVYFIVVDCPTEDHLESFVKEPEFVPFQGSPTKRAGMVIHFSPPSIMNNPKYQEWMSRFPSTTNHMRINWSNRVIDHVDAYRLQEKLHFLDPSIFPKLNEDNIPEVREEVTGKYGRHLQLIANLHENRKSSQVKQLTHAANEFVDSNLLLKPGFSEIEKLTNEIDVISAFSTFRWNICPERKIKFVHQLYLDRQNCLNEVIEIDNMQNELKKLKELKKKWEESEECKALPEYPKILFLGTGSSAPHALRNTSSILLELESGSLVMLDCGEGTYGQMLRFFGKEKIGDILKRIRLIYVSHQHADHHLGLVTILDMRSKILAECKREEYYPANERPDMCHLVMVLPPSVRNWIHSSCNFIPLLYDARIIVSSAATKSFNTLKRCTNMLGITNFKTIAVPHSYESYGLTFETSNGYQITYSGDTVPSDNLVELGRNTDLLIHEATFEDGMENEAKQKRHSTISQALNVGKRMGARFVMLTHFSQRYSHFPKLSQDLPENSGIAFDNMLVTPKMLPFLPKLMRFYKMIFADKIIELDSKSMKRMLRGERKELLHAEKMKL